MVDGLAPQGLKVGGEAGFVTRPVHGARRSVNGARGHCVHDLNQVGRRNQKELPLLGHPELVEHLKEVLLIVVGVLHRNVMQALELANVRVVAVFKVQCAKAFRD